MLSNKDLPILRRWLQRGVVLAAWAGLLAVPSPVEAQQTVMTRSALAANGAPSLTLTCTPCTLTAQQSTQVTFTLQVPARVAQADNFPGLQVARLVAGKSSSVLGTMSLDGISGNTATYKLTTRFLEQPGSFQVAAYARPRAAMAVENSSPVAGPVQITVQSSTQASSSGGSGWSGILSGLLGSVLGGGTKNQGTAGGSDQPPPTVIKTPPAVVRAQGVTFDVPLGFLFHGEIAEAGGPVSLRNFDRYIGPGVVPQGGAEIEVTSVPAGGTSMQALLRADTSADASQATVVDTLPARIATYTDIFGPGWSYESEAAYVAQDGRIYKFFLTYRSGDAGSSAYRRAFATVLNTTHFVAR